MDQPRQHERHTDPVIHQAVSDIIDRSAHQAAAEDQRLHPVHQPA